MYNSTLILRSLIIIGTNIIKPSLQGQKGHFKLTEFLQLALYFLFHTLYYGNIPSRTNGAGIVFI